jgi:hypothetical protein
MYRAHEKKKKKNYRRCMELQLCLDVGAIFNTLGLKFEPRDTTAVYAGRNHSAP